MKYLLLVLLAGCETVKVVQVPVPTPCIAAMPARPALVTDDDLKGMSDYRMVLALRQFHLAATGYIAELEAVATPCKK